jgi:RluA family pseudouridine synthase
VGGIRVNGKKAQQNYRLSEGDILEMDVDQAELPSRGPMDPQALLNLSRTDFFKRNLDILYEDDDLLACDKPTGLVVHPGTGHVRNDTLIDLVKSYMATKKRQISDTEPVLVHRIDRDTSGVILIAKNKRVLRYLHTHFRDHDIEKSYIAACHGRPPKTKGVIEARLMKSIEQNSGTKMTVHPSGMHAKSVYSVLQANASISVMEVTLSTGRTHQIRVHLASIGCPIVGDVRYGDKSLDHELFSEKNFERRLYLHAARIGFIHPIDGKRRTLTAPTPDAFKKFMKTID